MTDTQATTADASAAAPVSAAPLKSSAPPRLPLSRIHELPIPIRTYPLPLFVPHNPLSWLHIAWVVLGHTFLRPASEPSVVHVGVWDAASGSVHVTDGKSIRALWEQGFFGKGSLSRSEPNWLKREETRRGLGKAIVAETFTVERREERKRAKWERARAEQEAIRQIRLTEKLEDEARRAPLAASAEDHAEDDVKPGSPRDTHDILHAPVQVDNYASTLELVTLHTPPRTHTICGAPTAPVGPLELLALPNSEADLVACPISAGSSAPSPPSSINSSEAHESGATGVTPSKHARHGVRPPSPGAPGGPKNVRFSTLVESTMFETTDPPSPSRSPIILSALPDIGATPRPLPLPEPLRAPISLETTSEGPLVDKEHLQLMPEEAFFLVFGLGALKVIIPGTEQEVTAQELFTLSRQHSHYPPRPAASLRPDDNFLVNYAAYHHYRSLGWVPRAGIKFGVDWLLYARGPPFDHAEFGLILVQSFSDPWWKTNAAGRLAPQKSWAWLHGVLRVLTKAVKTFVLTYIEVPPPAVFEEALATGGAAAAIRHYHIREVVVRRWQPNRNRKSRD